MALTTEDLIEKARLSLDDLEGQTSKGATLNDRSASQLAASQAMMSGTSAQDYARLKSDLTSPESRHLFLQEQEAVRERLFKEAQGELVPTLADPLMSQEDKESVYRGSQYLKSAVETKTLPKMSSLDVLAEESLVADSGEETHRSATSRNLMMDSVGQIVKQKSEMTKRINALEIGKDEGVIGPIKDVAEMFVPFAEWIHYDQISTEMNKGEADFVLMGTLKQNLFNKIRDVPISERAAFAEALIETLSSNERLVLQEGNDLVKLNTLEKMLVDNDYSDFEKYFDNVVSILDAIGVGGTVKAVGKAPKTAKAVDKLAKAETALQAEADAFKARPSAEMSKAEVGLENDRLNFELDKKASEGAAPSPLQAEADKFATTPQNLGPMGEALEDEAALFKIDKALAEESNVMSDLEREALAYSARTDVIPSSPSQIVKDTNPEMSRNMHDIMASDETGQAAQALYGTTKEEALAKDLLPEPEIRKGSLPNKVEQRRPEFEEPTEIRQARKADGNIALSDKELEAVVAGRVSGDFREVTGMHYHPSSLVVRTNLDGTFGISARYSPLDGGHATFEDALEQAEVAFRNYGLQKENFQILAQRGDEWVETTAKELLSEATLRSAGAKIKLPAPSGYAVGVKYDYRFRPEDLDEVELLTSGGGILANAVKQLDRLPSQLLAGHGQGSLVQNLVDPASMIHPRIVNSASVAADKTPGLVKLYTQQFEKFSKEYASLPKDRRVKMGDYIHQANLEGIPLNSTDLYARGFTKREVETLKEWRKANDTMWYAANDDYAESLRARGTKVFIHKDSETKLMGTPMARSSISSKKSYFDPITNTTRSLTKDELDELYKVNGEILNLHDPLEINGELVEGVISTNTASGGFTRAIYDGEVVLHYREGYYPVSYDANFFIERVFKDADGGDIKKAIFAARDTKEAKAALKAIQQKEGLSDAEMAAKYSFRKDRRLAAARNSLFDEGSWSVATTSGLSAQRFRGKRLGDAGAGLQNIGRDHLKDPLVAVADQIHSLSKRVSMRKVMETHKKRFMLSYGKYLELPKNKKTGQPEMPKKIGDIKGKPGVKGSIVQDARTNFNYLYSLENGYINLIDEGYKGMMHVFADLLGDLGWSLGEKAAIGATKISPVQAAKTAAFKLFISGSPARQAVVQRVGQILQLGAINPKYLLGGLQQDYVGVMQAKIGLSKDTKYIDLFNEIKNVGILEAVDAHTLIRDDQLRLADLTVAQKIGSKVSYPLTLSQKVGFDAAEQDVLLTSWLAHRDLAVKAGKDVKNQRVKDEILAATRAFTLGMNRGNELAHTQNTISIISQFFSFRQKALLQGLSNRNLTWKEKLKLTTYTAVVFGPETTLLSAALYHYLSDDSIPNDTKDKIKAGLLDTTLNEVLTVASGEAQAIDFGDLAPSEAFGIGNIFLAMLWESPLEILTESPSGSLFFGNNPRVTDAFSTGLKYFYPANDYENPMLETRFSDVVVASANMFSGFSSGFKAKYAYETGIKMSGSGLITDDDITKVEAVFSGLGFRTKKESGDAAAREVLRFGAEASKGDVLKEDMDAWYSETKRHMARKGMSVREQELQRRVLSEAWRVFGDERERVVEYIQSKIERDAKDGDFLFLQGAISKMGFMNGEETLKLLNSLPAGGNRDALVAIYNNRKGQ